MKGEVRSTTWDMQPLIFRRKVGSLTPRLNRQDFAELVLAHSLPSASKQLLCPCLASRPAYARAHSD